jgi:hypothetical protein
MEVAHLLDVRLLFVCMKNFCCASCHFGLHLPNTKLSHPSQLFWSLIASLIPKIEGWSDDLIFFPSLHFSKIVMIAFFDDGAVLDASSDGVKTLSRVFLKFSFDALFWHRRTWDVFSFS